MALLFLEGMLDISLNEAIGVYFAVAMLGLVTGPAFFRREMHLAMRCIRLAYQDTV